MDPPSLNNIIEFGRSFVRDQTNNKKLDSQVRAHLIRAFASRLCRTKRDRFGSRSTR